MQPQIPQASSPFHVVAAATATRSPAMDEFETRFGGICQFSALNSSPKHSRSDHVQTNRPFTANSTSSGGEANHAALSHESSENHDAAKEVLTTTVAPVAVLAEPSVHSPPCGTPEITFPRLAAEDTAAGSFPAIKGTVLSGHRPPALHHVNPMRNCAHNSKAH